MLERARALATERGVDNVAFRLGDVVPLPFPDATFSIVTCRFAFHHFTDPRAVLAEMRRVCRPGGRVVVADLTTSDDPAEVAAFERMEHLRDPSHVRALTLAELEALFPVVGLPAPSPTFYRLECELEGVLARSFPAPGDADRIREMFDAAVADDGLGLGTRRVGAEIRFAYAVAILAAPR